MTGRKNIGWRKVVTANVDRGCRTAVNLPCGKEFGILTVSVGWGVDSGR
jgi:hypothetical protein